MACSAAPGIYPGINGSVSLQGRTLRFNLFKYLNTTEVSLGDSGSLQVSDLELTLDDSDECKLVSLKPEILPEKLTDKPDGKIGDAELAILHSPFLMIRHDQQSLTERDVPIGVTYSVSHADGFTEVTYTMFFSNETVKGIFSTSKLTSMHAYGRRTDIEWIYKVVFNSDQEVVSEKYQSGVVGGIGHSTKNFRGYYLPQTEHPILYNIAKHNVFSDHPTLRQRRDSFIGFHLVPREEIASPLAREWWMWNHPWTFDLSDRELFRDGVLDFPSEEYLYVLVSGKRRRGTLHLNLSAETTEGELESATHFKKLGEDLWKTETFSALWVGTQKLHGDLELTKNWESDFTPTRPLRFFRLKPDPEQGFLAEEVTRQVQCSGPAVGGRCRIKID